MKILLKKFEDLTAGEAFRILKLRQDVFIIEQDCIYPDIDGDDEKAHHMMVLKNHRLAGYSRIFAPGIKFSASSSIGRIVVEPSFRGTDVGSVLIRKSISTCLKLFPDAPVRIEAQAALEDYYKGYGFRPEGEVYVVDGIDHIQMKLIS